MHDLLFNRQDQWSGKADALTTFKAMAKELGLDQPRFDSCLDGGTYEGKVAADLQEGMQAGVSGTPAFRINGSALSGAQPFAEFQKRIDYFLAGGQPPTMEVAADSFRSLGRADAPVVVTEFSDFQCSACRPIAREVIPELVKRYVETGVVRWVHREFPLSSIHPLAEGASAAAVCAGNLGKYWEMHDKLINSDDWLAEGADPVKFYKAFAAELGLDSSAFDECLSSQETSTLIQGDLLAGESAGVNATPYFFVNDLPIRGGMAVDAFARVIDYVAAGGQMPQIEPQGEDFRTLGSQQAVPKMVAFVDYASADSAKHAAEVLPQLREAYIDNGTFFYILHPWSTSDTGPSGLAATAAECAGQQGKYWEMHDKLLSDQADWTGAADLKSVLGGYAESLGLTRAEFESCLDSDWARLRVQASAVIASLYGIPSAPVYLFNNGQALDATATFDQFKAQIDSMLGQ